MPIIRADQAIPHRHVLNGKVVVDKRQTTDNWVQLHFADSTKESFEVYTKIEVEDMPVLHSFLDLSSSVITAKEMARIASAPPRVIVHQYGAWVNVPPADPESGHYDDEAWDDFPRLKAVVMAAAAMGVWWVNIDSDGADVFPQLPTFEW